MQKFDLSRLPVKYQNNWHILTVLRSDACVAHAKQVADSTIGAMGPTDPGVDQWVAVFDAAAREWKEANPLQEFWVAGRWPDGASVYPGDQAIEEARRLMADE